MCGPQFRLILFTFRPLSSKQLNRLTTIVTFSWLGGAKVTHPLRVRELPGSIPGSGKFFVFNCVVVVVDDDVFFYLFVQKHIFVTTTCNFIHMLMYLEYILQDLSRILTVVRYRPSILGMLVN